MQKIIAYKLTDGSILEDKDSAAKKQFEINLIAQLNEFCKQNLYDTYRLPLFSDAEDLAEMLYNQREELRRIFAQTLQNDQQ